MKWVLASDHARNEADLSLKDKVSADEG